MLTSHRNKLVTEKERYTQLIETIDRTIAELRGEDSMSSADLYKGFSAEKQTEYEAWLTQRHGQPMRADIDHGRKRLAQMSAAEHEGAAMELQNAEQSLAKEFRRGDGHDSDAIDALIVRHRAWVTKMWGRPCSASAYASLWRTSISRTQTLWRGMSGLEAVLQTTSPTP